MENQSSESSTQTEEHTSTRNTGQVGGNMSFIDHLDELRKRLIKYLIVLTLCVLATYGFRKEILDLIRKPVDAPLKKYTATQQVKQQGKQVPITSLSSYNCACQEINSQPVSSTDGETEATLDKEAMIAVDASSDKNGASVKLDEVADEAEKWGKVAKETINDFVVFFQVLLGKDPSPPFDSEKYQTGEDQAHVPEFIPQIMPDQISLNCQCSIVTKPGNTKSPHSSMVFLGLPELFFAQMKVAIFAGFFLSFPFLLSQIWGFVGPALYRGEKKVFWIFSIFSFFFFIGGALFGYFVVFPYGFDFFLSLTQMGEIMPSLSVGEYLGFALKLLLAFGFIFELPLATFILARMGVVTPEIMIKQSRVAILVVFILSAMLTPPDPFTMMLMAGPLVLLYILSIGVCFLGVNRQKAAWRAQGLDMDEFEE